MDLRFLLCRHTALWNLMLVAGACVKKQASFVSLFLMYDLEWRRVCSNVDER